MTTQDLQQLGQLFDEKLKEYPTKHDIEQVIEAKLEQKLKQELNPLNNKIDTIQRELHELSMIVHDALEDVVTQKEFMGLEKRVEVLERN